MSARIVPLHTAKAEPNKRRPRDEARELLEQALDTGVRGTLRDAIRAALDVATAPVKRELTDLNYEALKPGQRLLDPLRPGLLARCTRAGVKLLYRFEHPESGKQTELLLGALGDVSLAQARASWKELRAMRMAGKVPTLTMEASRDTNTRGEHEWPYDDRSSAPAPACSRNWNSPTPACWTERTPGT